jgi:hypothetical protein
LSNSGSLRNRRPSTSLPDARRTSTRRPNKWHADAERAAAKSRDAENLHGGRMSAAARMIIELNIKHYRALLRTEADALKRTTIAALLAEEEAKLTKLPTNDRA